jgi:hypothetical protein
MAANVSIWQVLKENRNHVLGHTKIIIKERNSHPQNIFTIESCVLSTALHLIFYVLTLKKTKIAGTKNKAGLTLLL